MDLRPYIENINRQLAIAADAGGEEARTVAERVIPALDAAVRLALLDVLTAAAEEITIELAPGSVELRLRGREPEFVVTPPLPDVAAEDLADVATRPSDWPPASVGPASSPGEGDEGGMSRINFRMQHHLKSQIEQAAERDGLSVNAWLVRVVSAALERAPLQRRSEQHPAQRGQRYTGWVR